MSTREKGMVKPGYADEMSYEGFLATASQFTAVHKGTADTSLKKNEQLFAKASIPQLLTFLKNAYQPWQFHLFQKLKIFDADVLLRISCFVGLCLLDNDMATNMHCLMFPFPYMDYILKDPLSSRIGQLFMKLVQLGYPRLKRVTLNLVNSSDEKEEVIQMLKYVATSTTIDACSAVVWNVQRNDFFRMTQVMTQQKISYMAIAVTMMYLDLDKREPVAPLYVQNYSWLQALTIDVDYKSRELLSVVCQRTRSLLLLRIFRGKEKSRKGKLRRMNKEKRAVFLRNIELEKQVLFQVVCQCLLDGLDNNFQLQNLTVKDMQFTRLQRRDILEAFKKHKRRLKMVALENVNLDDDDCRELFPLIRDGMIPDAVVGISHNANITSSTHQWLKKEILDGKFKLGCYVKMTNTGITPRDSQDLEMYYHLSIPEGDPHMLHCLEGDYPSD